MSADGLLVGEDGVLRCSWAGTSPDYQAYHDAEWGLPVSDDRALFEKLCLEGFQAGLSWLTILRKRARFREVFQGFDPTAVARMDEADVLRLLADPGIVRHRKKIESTINNARRALALVEDEGPLAALVWRFEPPPAERPPRATAAALRTITQVPSSKALSKELKRRGWSFVGPTTVYAFMQAMGLVNDHVEGCAARPRVEAARALPAPALIAQGSSAGCGVDPRPACSALTGLLI